MERTEMNDKHYICDFCEYEDKCVKEKPCSKCCVLRGTDYFKLKSELIAKLA